MRSIRIPAPYLSRALALRQWPVFSLNGPLLAYVVCVSAGAGVAIAAAAATTSFRAADMVLFLVLLACAVFAVEATRHIEEPQGTRVKDWHSIWCLPIAVLLPPVYALLAPLPLMALVDLRIRRGVLYRRVFSAAAISLSLGAASAIFHGLSTPLGIHGSPTTAPVLTWAIVIVGCSVVRWFVNVVLVLIAVRAADPETTLWELLSNRESVYGDLVEVSLGVLVTVVVAVHPALVIVALPSVLLQQRFVLHGQLVTEARIDARTGLFNAHTWEREASTEVFRATRTKTPLAVLLLDIDHFKSVNDRYGHLAGDRVLRAVADGVNDEVRDYDIVGRIGGEEFAVLLPATDAGQAEDVAERLRHRVAGLTVPLDHTQDPAHIQVTVSVGATVHDGGPAELTPLLAAADLALYRAKNDGRDRVRLLKKTPNGDSGQ